MHYVLGVPGIWGPVPWSKAGPDQLLKSYKKGDPYGGPKFSHIFFKWSLHMVVVGIVMVKALTGI